MDVDVVLEVEPNNVDALINRASIKFIVRDCRGSILDGEKAVKLKPDSESAWFNLGMSYLAIQNYKDAERSFEKAYDINPQNREAHKYMMHSKRMMINFKDVV